MQPAILATAPRCGARTRAGGPCRSPAIHGRARCRMHGGRGSGAPRGNRNALKHGAFSARMKGIARYLRVTRLVVINARRAIALADCPRVRPAIARPMPIRPQPPTPIDLGKQPHAPGEQALTGCVFAPSIVIPDSIRVWIHI